MLRCSRHIILHGSQESAGTGRSATAAGEVDLGSGRHKNILEDSSSTVDSPAVLREAFSAALCLAGVREPELRSLLDDMVPEISKLSVPLVPGSADVHCEENLFRAPICDCDIQHSTADNLISKEENNFDFCSALHDSSLSFCSLCMMLH